MFLTFSAAGLRVHWNAAYIVQMIEEGFCLTIVDVHGVKYRYAEITDLSWSDKPDLSYWQPFPNLTTQDEIDNDSCREGNGDSAE
jgi:hypothetical protein